MVINFWVVTCWTFFMLGCSSQSFGQINSFYKFNEEIDSLFLDKEQYSLAAWSYSFIGEYQKALKAYDQTSRKDDHSISEKEVALLLSDYKARPAAEYIIERSKNEQIIIINEAHHQPLHRVFTESLLDGLYENGFRYLGLEALAEDSLLNIRKWPKVGDGYYTNEPQFGNLIREALRLGFTVFGYESTEKGKARERGQAINILKFLEKDPDAKILIHCGFGHVVEDGHPSWGKAMAGLLGELANIDPFTIDQVNFSERGHPDYESLLYKSMALDRSSVFVDSSNRPFAYRPDSASIDISVIHPRTLLVSDRPDWLLRSNSWKEYKLEGDLDLTFPCLIAAYYSHDVGTESVPVDLIEVDSIHQKSLILPPVDFILHITDSTGKAKTKKITVSD
jgi:hypothetical protein